MKFVEVVARTLAARQAVDIVQYIDKYRYMNTSNAVQRLAALAHATRLSLFRLLVQKGPEGLCVGDIGAKLGVAQPTISFHLKELVHAGLIKSRQEGRFVYYAADFRTMNSLLSYLTENCCGGRDCAPACASTQEKAA